MALIGNMQYLTIGDKTYRIASSQLPIASASTLGGIKVGTGLTIDSTTGVLNATGTSLTIDNELNGTSTNPVQNKVIKEALDDKIEQAAFYVTISGDATNGYTADKTFVEVEAAYEAGYAIYAINGTSIFPLALKASAGMNFTRYAGNTGKQIIWAKSSNAITITSFNLTTDNEIPTKTSDLTNDSGFVTNTGQITINGNSYPIVSRTVTTVSDVEGLAVSYNDGTVEGNMVFLPDGIGMNTVKTAIEKQIPTKTSDLTNDSNFMSGMTILSYGTSTWNDFITAYKANHVVYCRASSNANPASGSQTRMAFMAYVSDATNPTNVEFQYYRSVSSHSASQQGDQVYVYKLTSGNSWTVTVREASVKITTGSSNGINATYSNGAVTIGHTNSVTAQTTQAVYPIKIDKNGHISAYGSAVTIPTKTSDLTNDAGYTTNTGTITQVKTTAGTHTTINVSSGAATFNVPTKTSHLTNDSGFITDAGARNLLDGSAVGSLRGVGSVAESSAYTIGQHAFAEGCGTKASGNYSHAEGIGDDYYVTASGTGSHAEGCDTTASGNYSHAQNCSTQAKGLRSSAAGWGTIASGENQFVIGKWNTEDTSSNYAFIIGKGSGPSGSGSSIGFNRSDALTVDWDGKLTIEGHSSPIGSVLSTSGSTSKNLSVNTTVNLLSLSLPIGVWAVSGSVSISSASGNKSYSICIGQTATAMNARLADNNMRNDYFRSTAGSVILGVSGFFVNDGTADETCYLNVESSVATSTTSYHLRAVRIA